MKKHVLGMIVWTLLIGSGMSHAQDADEAAVRQEETTIDQSAGQGQTPRVEALAGQYGVEQAQVESLRGKTGWGGTTIQLAMAQNLMKTDPKTYPTMTDALAKVEALRSEGKGYGAIAKELGFKLGPVVSAAQHTRNQMRHDAHHSQAPSNASVGKPEHPAKPEKMNHPPKAERPPKAPKPEKPPKP
jgi:hypothetical protein